MKSTLEFMKLNLTGKENTQNLNELISEYQITQANNILAFVFVSNYALLKSLSDKYNFDNETKASFCLTEIHNSLLTYDFVTSKYTTYLSKCVINKFRELNCRVNTKQRGKGVVFESNETVLENIQYSNTLEYFNENDFLKSYALDDINISICKLLSAGYNKSEIATIKNLSKSTVYKRISKICEKIELQGRKIS